MEYFQAVAQRYCHKVALDKDQPVPDADLKRIVEAGMAAPSAANEQSPEFVIVTDKDALAKIGEWSGHEVLASAPAMIAVLTQPRMRQSLDIQTECLIADFAVATGYMLLAATALGYACGWLDSPFADDDLRRKTNELLGLPGDRFLALMVPVGKPANEGPRREKKPFVQRASWQTYSVER